MRIISRKALREFWEQSDYADSEQPLKAWFDEAKQVKWKTPNQIKEQYKSASILKDNRVVFNIHGSKYRLIVKINYDFGYIFIRFVGTHKQHDKIEANKV